MLSFALSSKSKVYDCRVRTRRPKTFRFQKQLDRVLDKQTVEPRVLTNYGPVILERVDVRDDVCYIAVLLNKAETFGPGYFSNDIEGEELDPL